MNILLLILTMCASPDLSTKNGKEYADVISVSTSGTENNYTFSVGIESPDTGCKQYADWWEVVSEEGDLVYRRILAHSHSNEQPFIRSGGKVKIEKGQKVIIRAHMNNTGYGGVVFSGSVDAGFEKIKIDPTFASNVEAELPQPSGCAF